MEAARDLADRVGVQAACRALDVPRASFYRALEPAETAEGEGTRPAPPRSLGPDERGRVLDYLHSERFWDVSPAQAWATLLDEGAYLCGVRTVYRALAQAGEARERRAQLTHPAYAKPELLATGPNQVWSWDITKLRGPVKWTYFYLYFILDIFSRYAVGWMVATREAAHLAARPISATCEKQHIAEGELTVHADRGSSMRSKTLALLLADLGVTKTHPRPYASKDNPYSEAHFKTLKYRPEFPNRFGCLEDARAFCQDFFSWYNLEHRHPGIGYLTPEMVHYGLADEVTAARQMVLWEAHAAHPERFVNKAPEPPKIPDAVWINKPSEEGKGLEIVGMAREEVIAP